MQGPGTLKDENSVDAGNDTTLRPTETPQRVVSTMVIFIAMTVIFNWNVYWPTHPFSPGGWGQLRPEQPCEGLMIVTSVPTYSPWATPCDLLSSLMVHKRVAYIWDSNAYFGARS